MSLPRISSRQNRDLSYLVVLDVSKQPGFTSPCYLVAQDCIDMKNPYKSMEQEQNEQQELPQTTVRHLGWSPGRRTYGEVSRHDRNGEIRRFCGVSPNALLLRFCEMQSFSIITHTHKHSCCTFSLIFERCGWVRWGYARPWLPVQKSAGKVPEQASMTKCAHPTIPLTDRISTSHQHRFGTIICAGTKPGIMPSRLCPPLSFSCTWTPSRSSRTRSWRTACGLAEDSHRCCLYRLFLRSRSWRIGCRFAEDSHCCRLFLPWCPLSRRRDLSRARDLINLSSLSRCNMMSWSRTEEYIYREKARRRTSTAKPWLATIVLVRDGTLFDGQIRVKALVTWCCDSGGTLFRQSNSMFCSILVLIDRGARDVAALFTNRVRFGVGSSR
jgi:hypothetical protein